MPDLEEFDGYPLGCNLPAEFPTFFPKAAGAAFATMTIDQIRADLANRPGRVAFNRRFLFGDDWVKDQSRFGSCNGWSTATALEKLHYLRTGQWVKLSGADAYSQMNGGRDRGSALGDGLKVVQTGIAPESLVRVDQIFTRQISDEAKAARARFRGFEPFAVDDEAELATGILLGFMGVIATHVERGYDSLDGEGCPRSGNGPGNHSVHVDDVKLAPDGTLLFDSPNNWRVSWGDRGRCYYRWNQHLRETVKYHRFWLLKSTMDDPQGVNPPAAQG